MKRRGARGRARRWLLRGIAAIALPAIAGVAYETAAETLEATRYPPPGRRVDIGGRRLHLVCAGHGAGTVVLEAGGTHCSTHYARLLKELARPSPQAPPVRVCAYDRAGMGWSDPSPRPSSAQALADDLDRLLKSARLPPPYFLAAGSAGGLTVELFARLHPERTGGLVMLDALAGSMIDEMPTFADGLAREARLARILSRFGVLRVLDPLERRSLPRRDLEVALTYRNATWDAVDSLVSARTTSAAQLRAAPPLARDLPLVVIRRDPALSLANGDEDDRRLEPLWQAAQARLASRSSRGELVDARGSGHHIVTDRPDLVRAAILRVVARTAAPQQ